MPRARPSDHIHWAEILESNTCWLRAVVWSRVGGSEGTEEVMQEVAAAALASPSPPRLPEKIPAWLYQIAVRQSLLYRRQRGRDRKKMEAYAQSRGPSETGAKALDPLQWLVDSERNELIRAALERLPRRDREILLLKYAEDWTYLRISERLGTSESAVESRLHRARKRLRDAMLQAELIGPS